MPDGFAGVDQILAELPPEIPPGEDEAHWLGHDSLGGFIGLNYPRFECEEHHAGLIAELEAIERGDFDRLIVTFPPRHGKSLICSEHFPAWFLGRDPTRFIITTSYSQELSNDFGVKTVSLMGDDLYRRVFPGVALHRRSRSARRFYTTAGGAFAAVGRNGSLTGRGAHLLLMDDMVKGREEADSETIRAKIRSIYAEAAYTRLMKGGRIVLVGTRWHDDDLIGWVQKEHGHEGWRVVNFPALKMQPDRTFRALWPNHFPVEHLLRIRKTLGSRAFTALYQQRPYTEEGAIIKRAWWQPWTDPAPKDPSFIVISLDGAYTEDEENDSSACTVWYVLDDDSDLRQRVLLRYAWAKKLEFPELCDEVQATWETFSSKRIPTRLLIEKKASGLSVIQELRRRLPEITIWGVDPQGDKVARAHSVTTAFEAGKVSAMAVVTPDGEGFEFRPWAEEVIDQCVAFPRRAEKDLVDSTTQAMRHIRDMGTTLFPEDDPPPPGVDSKGRPTARHRSDRTTLYAPIGASRRR